MQFWLTIPWWRKPTTISQALWIDSSGIQVQCQSEPELRIRDHIHRRNIRKSAFFILLKAQLSSQPGALVNALFSELGIPFHRDRTFRQRDQGFR
jgi:hypothetical protein